MIKKTTRWEMPNWFSWRVTLFSTMMFLAACSTDSCSCDGFEEAPFPEQHYDKTLPAGGQIRLTSSGLDFVKDQVPALIEQFQPGGLSFCVPASDGTVDICKQSTCDDGSDGCQLDLDIDQAQLNPQPTDTLEVDITIGGIGGKDANGNPEDVIDIKVPVLGTCDLLIYNKDGDESKPAQVSAKLPIIFGIDQQSATRDIRVEVGEIEMAKFTDQVKYKLKGGVGCTIGSWLSGLFNGTINGQIKDQLTSAIDGIKADQLCRACGDDEPACPSNSTCGENGGGQSCMYSGGECVPRLLGIEGKLKLGELIGSYSQNPTADVDIMARLADMATVDTGVNLGLRVGAQPPNYGRCVPVDPTQRPSFDAIPPSPELLSDTTPSGDSFMLGIGVHKRTVEQLLWSVWGGGVLCMKLDSNQVSQLSTSALGVFLPSISDLAGKNAMAFLQLAPQNPPTVELGKNTVTERGSSYEITDPLAKLSWKDVDVHFFVYALERNVRAFTLRVDLELPVAVASDGQGSIIPVLGDMDDAIKNIRPVKSELLAEDPQVLIDLIPTLVGLALPSLAGSISNPLELPEVFDYRISLDQDDITSVDDKTMIALFADLAPATHPYGVVPQARIRKTDLDMSRHTDSGVPRPVLAVDVSADLPGFSAADALGQVEYSWRVGGGLWSLYTRSERLEIRDPLLVLQGNHRLEVRARIAGDVGARKLPVATTFVRVDYAAPELEFERQGTFVKLNAFDAVDKAEDMTYRYQIIDAFAGADDAQADWSAWGDTADLDLVALDAPERFKLRAEVRDGSGFITRTEETIEWDRRAASLERDDFEQDESSAEAQSSGCSATGSQSPMGGLLGLLSLGGALFWTRRRKNTQRYAGQNRLMAALMLALIALLGVAGCSSDSKKAGAVSDEKCDPECADNEICLAGTCTPVDSACESDGDCTDYCGEAEVGTCSDSGVCQCASSCADGCAEDQFCCNSNNSCKDLPDPCAGKTCDEGFAPEATNMGTGNPDTCEVSGATCDCVAMPPIPMGVLGYYTAADQRGQTRALSTYNRTYTDLMVGIVDASDEITWHFVDGMPDSGAITGDVNGPRGGIAIRGPNVGTHTAIGIDAQDNLHVLYRDEDNKTLKYARGSKSGADYSFETTTLSDPDQGSAGLYTNLLIIDDTVHAIYTADDVKGDNGEWLSQLRYINFPTSAPLDQLAPQAKVLIEDEAGHPCGNSCVGSRVCVTSGEPRCEIPTRDCGSCDEGMACIEGSCEPQFVTLARSYPQMAAVLSQLTTTESGLAVTFYNARKNEVGWVVQTPEGWAYAEYLGKESGPYASGAWDADGQLHLAYMDPTTQSLIYEQPGTTTRETIEDGARDSADGYVLSDIGEDVTLKLAADGKVTVLYQDATWHKLIMATRSTSGDWTQQTLAEPASTYDGAHGFFATMVRSTNDATLAVDAALNNQEDPASGKVKIHSIP